MISIMLQVRMSSTRLPGKVLRMIDGRPMLSYMIERLRKVCSADNIIVLTSIDSSDDVIQEFCESSKILCYRGSLDDVLDRYYQAAKKYKVSTIIRVTGDCPILDPLLIDEMIELFSKNNCDYLSNTAPPPSTYPDGMDIEIFGFENLEEVWSSATKPSDREHVTFGFWKNKNKYSCMKHDLSEDYSHYRLTVDYPEDLLVISNIIENLYVSNPYFSLQDIISYLKKNPDVGKLNSHIVPNQGWQTAYEKDRALNFNC